MNNFLKHILAVDIPSVEEVVESAKQEVVAEQAQEQASLPPGERGLAAIQFLLMQDGTMHLKMQWLDESENAGTVFGEFLHRINTGTFKGACVDLLNNMQKTNIKNKVFVGAAIKEWSKRMEEDDDEPLVNPLSVFGMSRNMQGEESHD